MSTTEITIATPMPRPRPLAAASIAHGDACGIRYTRLGTEVSTWAAIRTLLELQRERSQGVESSPVTAPKKSAAVAAPAAPCGPTRSIITGTTGSRIWKVIAMQTASRPMRTVGLMRDREIKE